MYISTKLEKALIVHTARCGAPNKTEVITPRFVPETKLWRGTSHGRGRGRGCTSGIVKRGPPRLSQCLSRAVLDAARCPRGRSGCNFYFEISCSICVGVPRRVGRLAPLHLHHVGDARPRRVYRCMRHIHDRLLTELF